MESRNNTNRILALIGVGLLVAVLATAALLAAFLPAGWLTARRDASASAAPIEQPVTAAEPSVPISVRGSGIINARPDTMKMNVGVSIQESTVKAAQTKVTEVIEAMTARLQAANVEEKDYRTAQYSVEPVMDYPTEKGQAAAPRLIGFRVTSMLEITLRDTARGPELLDALTTAGANTIYNVSYTFAEPALIEQQAYDMAVKDAEARATKLAGLSGLKLGRIVSISEPSTVAGSPLIAEKGMGAGGAGFYAGQQSVQVDVIVTYDSAPAK